MKNQKKLGSGVQGFKLCGSVNHSVRQPLEGAGVEGRKCLGAGVLKPLEGAGVLS